MADFGASDLDGFRVEARKWLEANFPSTLRGKGAAVLMQGQTSPESIAWTKAMGGRGWGTPTWPKAYGGGGLSAAEARVLNQEMAALGAWNPIGGMGVMMFGP